jgi:O-antigen/teichoic acid export membrane protein
MLTLVGAVTNGLLGFVAVLVVTHGLGPARTGGFFEGVSVFTIGSDVLLLGADVALLRFVSLDRAEGRGETTSIFWVALLPIFVVALLVAVVGQAAIPRLAQALSHGGSPRLLTTYLRGLVLAVPLAVTYLACVSTTRAFGTVKPFVLIDKVLRPLLQVVLLLIVVLLGLDGTALAGAWVVPVGIGLVATVWWMRRRMQGEPPSAAGPWLPLAARFWRFSTARGLAGMFQVLILWLDTLLIGFFRPPVAVAIYTASTRAVLVVLFVGIAIQQAVAPQFGDLLARREIARAEVVFRTATAWNILFTWPILVMLAIFAPVVLSIFGTAYQSGADVTRILAMSMVIGTTVGPVDWILLMEGKSSWNLLNTAVALGLNVGLNLLLIPRIGIVGAAIAWGVSIIVNDYAPLLEVMAFVRISPFGRVHRLVSLAALACFGLPGLAAAALMGQTLTALIVSSVVALAAYVVVVRRFAAVIQVSELLGGLRRPVARPSPMRARPSRGSGRRP